MKLMWAGITQGVAARENPNAVFHSFPQKKLEGKWKSQYNKEQKEIQYSFISFFQEYMPSILSEMYIICSYKFLLLHNFGIVKYLFNKLIQFDMISESNSIYTRLTSEFQVYYLCHQSLNTF